MKHKLLISVIAALSIGTTAAFTSQNVQASVVQTKHSIKYFNKWRTIKLKKKTEFTEVLNNLAPQSMWNKYQKGQLQGRSQKLPKGTKIRIKGGKYDWILKSKKLPTPKHYYHWTTYDISDFVKYEKPVNVSPLFNKKRTVKLTKNVKMVKQRAGHPLAFTRVIGFKTLKKGTIVTVQAGGRDPYLVWSKQLPISNKDDFWLTGERGTWYKILD